MVSSHTDIKQLIAENFPPAGAPDVLGTFGNRAARSPIVAAATRDAPADNAAAADIVFIEAEGQKVAMIGPVTETERRNTETGLRGQVFDRKRHEEIAEVRSGYIELTGVGAASEKAKRERQDRERRAQRNADYMMLLQAQIADLEKRLGGLYNERDRLMDRYLSPQERAAVAALPPEKQTDAIKQMMRDKVKNGQLTPDEYDQWQAEWDRNEREIRETKAELSEKQNELKAAGSDLDRRGATLAIDATPHALDTQYAEVANLAGRTEDLEIRKLHLSELVHYNGSDRIQRIDEFIATADEKTISDITNSPDKYGEIGVRFSLMQLKSELTEWDQYKGTPDYAMYVQTSIDNFPDDVKDALRNEPNLSEEITAALYMPFSDSLDEPTRVAEAGEPQTQRRDEPISHSGTAPSGNQPGPA